MAAHNRADAGAPLLARLRNMTTNR